MSPERKAIIDAINLGNRTTSLIALAIHKPPQTVAKMVSKLKKLGIILVDNSGCFYIPVDNTVDSNVDISTPKSTHVDNSILTRLNFIEDSLAQLTQKNTESKQQFEQLKNELLSELKKSSLNSVSSDQMNQTIVALKTENIELSNQLEKQTGLIQKLTTDNNQLVLKNRNKFETMEQLQADIKRLDETNAVSTTRSTEAEKERDEALSEVVTLASENTELRSKLEAVSATEIEHQSEPIDTTEHEQNDSKNEPENKPEIKFTLDEAHERFDELRDQFPGKKQAELIIILNSEGYTNSKGKRLVPSTISRWHDEWEKKAGKK